MKNHSNVGSNTGILTEEDKQILSLIREREKSNPCAAEYGTLKFDKDKVWLWGGPTELWGGTMDKDCLVKGAAYFGTENLVYVYGENNRDMLDQYKSFKKVLCQITHVNRNPDSQPEDDVANAENLSQISLNYDNIAGGIIDDLSTTLERFPPDKLAAIYRALKSRNPLLQLYAVAYTFELEKDFSGHLPYIDAVNLWVWRKHELADLDQGIERCAAVFPGKPVILGIFMHDYGSSETAIPLSLLEYNFTKARQYLSEGKIEGVVVLGDREIAKHPVQAQWIKKRLGFQR